MCGTEWLIDAHGCEAAALRDPQRLAHLFQRLIDELELTPVAPAAWHVFPEPGGVTGFVMLAESHLACHTFPEFGSICLNVFCCRQRPAWDARTLLSETLGATGINVRRLDREYAESPLRTVEREPILGGLERLIGDLRAGGEG